MRKLIITLSLITAGLVAGLMPGVAAAQDGTPPPAAPPPDPSAPSGSVATATTTSSGAPALTGISVFGIVPFDGFGVGLRYMMPIPIPSLLHHSRIKDSWAVEFGADVLYLSYDYVLSNYHETHILPLAGVMWNVWLTPQFAVYPKAEAGFSIRASSSLNGSPSHSGVYIAGEAGLLYQVSKSVTLRAELGSYGARGGVGFFF